MRLLPTPRHLLIALVAVTVLAAIATGIAHEDYFATTVMFAAAVGGVYVWTSRYDLVVRLIATAMIIGATAGWGIDLYGRYSWYDDFLHLTMSIGGAILVGRVLFPSVQVPSRWLAWTLIWLVWLGIGSLWEIGEWLADQLEGTNHSRGYLDTMLDMIFNTIGAAIGAAIHVWRPGPAASGAASVTSNATANMPR